MRDSNVANPTKESAQVEFPHGLLEFCNRYRLQLQRQSQHDFKAVVTMLNKKLAKW
jgi:hypothetical protein